MEQRLLFKTARLIVSRFNLNDKDDFFRLNSNEEVVRFIRPVKTKEESDAFLQENIHLYTEGSSLGRFAVHERTTRHFIGTFSFLYLSGEDDFHIGYALLPEAWGKGFATELVRAGIHYIFDEANKQTLFAITESANGASQRVLLKAGFLPKGNIHENGKLLDLFQITREEFDQKVIQNK